MADLSFGDFALMPGPAMEEKQDKPATWRLFQSIFYFLLEVVPSFPRFFEYSQRG